MGWKENQNIEVNKNLMSQSAFAGYGLKSGMNYKAEAAIDCRNPLSLDMGWKDTEETTEDGLYRRNPLSLDMGWKERTGKSSHPLISVAIRFRWIWVEKAGKKRLLTTI